MARMTGVRVLIVAAGCVPALTLLLRWFWGDGLGANPIEEVTHVTGEFALIALLLTLCVTPARRLLGWSWLARERRTLGLLAFGYGCLHLATYAALDQFFAWDAIVEDILERPFITAGFAAFLSMLPLAATSNQRMMKRLGQRWVTLHRGVYLTAILAIIHLVWLTKGDEAEPFVFAGVLVLLLGYRGLHAARRRRRAM